MRNKIEMSNKWRDGGEEMTGKRMSEKEIMRVVEALRCANTARDQIKAE